MPVCKLILITVLSCFAHWVTAAEINIAVAANFAAVMRDIVTVFEQSTGHQVNSSFGSSGKFYAQIKNGAPFQVFFSADQAKPEALEREGLVVPGSRITYAVGALALWSIKPGLVDGDATGLKTAAFNKLALANPRLAPYGAAAVQVLENMQLKALTQPKWVQGDNIAQTYQFVSSANADMGFVAVSQIMHRGHIEKGFAWIVPRDQYSPIRQDAVLLQQGEHSEAARALLRFMRSQSAREIIYAYGYQIPSANRGKR